MRLTDLNPRYDGQGNDKVLVFDCPKHCNMFESSHSFRIPVAGPGAWSVENKENEDFTILTLAPSIWDTTPNGKCGLHFFIVKGEIKIV